MGNVLAVLGMFVAGLADGPDDATKTMGDRESDEYSIHPCMGEPLVAHPTGTDTLQMTASHIRFTEYQGDQGQHPRCHLLIPVWLSRAVGTLSQKLTAINC